MPGDILGAKKAWRIGAIAIPISDQWNITGSHSHKPKHSLRLAVHVHIQPPGQVGWPEYADLCRAISIPIPGDWHVAILAKLNLLYRSCHGSQFPPSSRIIPARKGLLRDLTLDTVHSPAV